LKAYHLLLVDRKNEAKNIKKANITAPAEGGRSRKKEQKSPPRIEKKPKRAARSKTTPILLLNWIAAAEGATSKPNTRRAPTALRDKTIASEVRERRV